MNARVNNTLWQNFLGRRAGWRCATVLAVIIAALFVADAHAVTPQYTVTVLNTAGDSKAVGINSLGQVAGNGTFEGGFLYTPGVGVTPIGVTSAGGRVVNGINDYGQIVGDMPVADAGLHAFVYTPGVGITDINGPGFYVSHAYDINNAGLVVGYNQDPSPLHPGSNIGYAYDAGTQAFTNLNVLLGNLPASTVVPQAVNENGVPVGAVSFRAAKYEPYINPITSVLSTYEDLGALTAGGLATDVNDFGLAVGSSSVAGLNVAVVYLGGGGASAIGGIGSPLQSWALSVNNAGQIVGNSQSAPGLANIRGFVRIGGVNYDLNNVIDPGLDITEIQFDGLNIGVPDAINEWGQIAAYGNVAGLGQRALILSPTTPVAGGISLAVPGTAVRTTKFVAGMDFDQFIATTNPLAGSLGTTVELLGGAAGANRDVKIGFDANGSFGGLAADVVTVSGTADDVFVLQITYDEALAIATFGSEANAFLAWLDPNDNVWKNAVLGNTGGTPFSVLGAYDSLLHFHLGYYGVDTVNNTVWAVLNHNSSFSVIGDLSSVPEPTTAALVLVGSAALSVRRRR